MASKIICHGKHTKYQPSDSEFNCPSCGAEAGDFYIDSVGRNANEECDKLHKDDYIVCDGCKENFNGVQVVNLLRKKSKRKVCSHCKGQGYTE